MRAITAGLLLLGTTLGPSFGENLHQKFGSGWSCKMISADETALISACQICEQRGEEFNKTSALGGTCENGEFAKLNTEMERLERQGKQSEFNKLNQEMRQLESEVRNRKAAPDNPNQPDPNAVVFQLRNMHKNSVQASFFSQNRRVAWPGNDRAYTLNDSEPHTYRLECRQGERICFGAWLTGNSRSYWGVGFDGDEGCQGCCVFCGSSSVHVYNLFPSKNGSSSNPASVIEFLGAAVGVAGAIAGAAGGSGGGGGSVSRGSPGAPAGQSFRDRPSGVSGGR
jgi:hypothetical protein